MAFGRIIRVTNSFKRLKRFIPGHARRVRHRKIRAERGIIDHKAVAAKKNARRVKMDKLKEQKKLNRAKNIQDIRKSRLAAEKASKGKPSSGSFKSRFPSGLRRVAVPAAGLTVVGGAGLAIGRRQRRRKDYRR